MLSNRKDASGALTIEDLRHPFVRLPKTETSSLFQGWGPRI